MNREEAITVLKAFIQSNTSENGSACCFDTGEPVAYFAEILLEALTKEVYPESCEEEYLLQVEEELRCFLCHSKHPSPNCECCGTCPD